MSSDSSTDTVPEGVYQVGDRVRMWWHGKQQSPCRVASVERDWLKSPSTGRALYNVTLPAGGIGYAYGADLTPEHSPAPAVGQRWTCTDARGRRRAFDVTGVDTDGLRAHGYLDNGQPETIAIGGPHWVCLDAGPVADPPRDLTDVLVAQMQACARELAERARADSGLDEARIGSIESVLLGVRVERTGDREITLRVPPVAAARDWGFLVDDVIVLALETVDPDDRLAAESRTPEQDRHVFTY